MRRLYSATSRPTLRHTALNQPDVSSVECWTLTPLCVGHPEVLRWLVEGPELGVSPFPCILMGSVGVLSVVCSVRFKVLCRSTKSGPSAPLVSPPSSLKSWTGPPSRQKTWWMKLSRSRQDETWRVWTDTGLKLRRTQLETFGQDVIWDRWPTWTLGKEEEIRDKVGVLPQDFMGWREMGQNKREKGQNKQLDIIGIQSRNIINANKTEVWSSTS